MGSVNDLHQPSLPFPLFKISSKSDTFVLYDINTITWLRKTHNILGVLVGTLPQFPQQNVFLGLPLELQSEEARLLVEKGVAYIIDDLKWHTAGMQSMTTIQKETFKMALCSQGKEAARKENEKREMVRDKAMKRAQDRNKCDGDDVLKTEDVCVAEEAKEDKAKEDEALFDKISQSSFAKEPNSSKPTDTKPDSWIITPVTSSPPLQLPPVKPSSTLPPINPSSYALFKHLHSLGYFISPGLRFGCQFLVYPGDPLRFHSHFLAMAIEWEEEIDLLDLVGGGRLGTGVKKGWLIGGSDRKESAGATASLVRGLGAVDANAKVRTFCIEWGGM